VVANLYTELPELNNTPLAKAAAEVENKTKQI